MKKTPSFPCMRVSVRLSPPLLALSPLLDGLYGGGHMREDKGRTGSSSTSELFAWKGEMER